jgi:hypothetical protein
MQPHSPYGRDTFVVSKRSLLHKLPMLTFFVGAISLTFWATGLKSDVSRSMYAYLFAYVTVLSIALGSLIFVLIQHATRAGWSILVRRIPEAAMATLPLLALLFAPIAVFSNDIFTWIHVEAEDANLAAKAPYLNLNFFYLRAIIYLLGWSVLGWWFYKTSVGQDNGGRTNDTRRMTARTPVAILFFALSLSFASFDWVMSLQPHWYSTMFGVYYFACSFQGALAFIALVAMLLQTSGALKEVNAEHYQDLGKLTFGFIVFWAYIAFSQFMIYWYGNIPEEMEFYAMRLRNGWGPMSWAMPFTHFFIPFFWLMSKHVKRYKPTLMIGCLWVIATRIVDMYWLVLPTYGGHGEHASHFAPNWMDGAALLGLSGIFLGATGFLLLRGKVAPAGDPRLFESVAFENA